MYEENSTIGWLENINEKSIHRLKFKSIDGKSLSLDFDSFFIKGTDRYGHLQINPQNDEIGKYLRSITANDYLRIEYAESKDSFFIEGLETISYLVPNDTQFILIDNRDESDNYSLLINKYAYFEQDKFKYILNPDKNQIIWITKPTESLTQWAKILPSLHIQQIEYIKKISKAFVELSQVVNNKLSVGLGISSVYETGICLHQVFGFPYIPGSGVKGIIRSWIIQEIFEKLEVNALKSKLFCDIFGCDKTSYYKKTRQGQINFYDTYPSGKVTIEPDVMTPHYGDYYTHEDIPPADYLQPNPIFFLTVKNTQFTYRMSTKSLERSTINEYFDDKGPGRNDELVKMSLMIERLHINRTCTVLDFIKTWLIDALKYHGVGSKTAVGYGKMEISWR